MTISDVGRNEGSLMFVFEIRISSEFVEVERIPGRNL